MSGPVRQVGAAPIRWSAALLAAGCAISPPLPPAAPDAGPLQAAERFLDAADRQDLDAMAHAFGTDGGSIADTGGRLGCGLRRVASWLGAAERCPTRQEVEVRMYAIAEVLRHDGYQLTAAEPVPGRDRPVTRVSVEVRRGERIHRDVGVFVISTSSGWLVESVELEKITGR